MERRLPNEPEDLIRQLTSWIDWRYSGDSDRVLTSAPSSIPRVVERWMQQAVWRLVWFESGAAILYGLAPSGRPGKYFVVKHDALNSRREGMFEKLLDGEWHHVDGDELRPGSDLIRAA